MGNWGFLWFIDGSWWLILVDMRWCCFDHDSWLLPVLSWYPLPLMSEPLHKETLNFRWWGADKGKGLHWWPNKSFHLSSSKALSNRKWECWPSRSKRQKFPASKRKNLCRKSWKEPRTNGCSVKRSHSEATMDTTVVYMCSINDVMQQTNKSVT